MLLSSSADRERRVHGTASPISISRAPTSTGAGSISSMPPGLRHHRPARPIAGVLTHGFTPRPRMGNKMSKVAGQLPSPRKQVHRPVTAPISCGCGWRKSDYTGLTCASGRRSLEGRGRQLSPPQNTMRFLLGAVAHFDEAERVAPADMPRTGTLGPCTGLARTRYRSCAERLCYATGFPGGSSGALQLRHGGALGLLFRHPQGRALLRRRHRPRRRAARTVLDLLFHRLTTWLAAGGGLTPWRRSGWSGSPGADSSVHLQDMPQTPEGLARRRAGGEMGSAVAPGGRRVVDGVRWRSRRTGPQQGDRRLARGRPGGACGEDRECAGGAEDRGLQRTSASPSDPADRPTRAPTRPSACPRCRASAWSSRRPKAAKLPALLEDSCPDVGHCPSGPRSCGRCDAGRWGSGGLLPARKFKAAGRRRIRVRHCLSDQWRSKWRTAPRPGDNR